MAHDGVLRVGKHILSSPLALLDPNSVEGLIGSGLGGWLHEYLGPALGFLEILCGDTWTPQTRARAAAVPLQGQALGLTLGVKLFGGSGTAAQELVKRFGELDRSKSVDLSR